MNDKLKKILNYLINPIGILMLFSLCLTFAVDAISRGSISLTTTYISKHGLTFLFNALVILLTLSITLLIRRKYFAYLLLSAIWLGLSITNNILLKLRGVPLTGSDFKLIESGLKIIDTYLSKESIKAIIIGVFVIVSILILVFIFAPKSKKKINYLLATLSIICIFFTANICTSLALEHSIISTNFWNLSTNYEDYGFPYCFSRTVLTSGMKKPNSYSEDSIESLIDSITNSSANVETLASITNELTSDSSNANIIMVQLESFFDPKYIKGAEYDIDPIPTFSYLKENYSTGSFSVSTIGSGTANTEFETISGLNLDFFGPGEYPYNTILKNKACSSINYALKESGYSTHAIHNHQGNFYGRNTVFSNLGFDTFTPIEFMNATEKTPVGWAKDSALITPIMESLTSTEGKDFIYTISVQGHGSYIGSDALENKYVNLTSIENEGIASALEYYVNQLYEMDVFIADLIEAVSSLNEDCVIVFYGDHLPSLGLTDESLSTGNIYETEYVIWDNMGLEKNDVDLEAYQLTSKVLYDLHMNNGIFTQLHQSYLFGLENEQFTEKDSYLDALRSLQYDILYGDEYLYNSQEAPKPTNLQFGINPIILNDVYLQDGQLVATGENFNQNTIFLVDGNFINTTFIDSNTVTCPAPELKPEGSAIFLGQISGGAQLLSATVTVTVMP